MADIWSNVGSSFSPQGNGWLYQVGSQVRGPVPEQTLATKLLQGEVTPKTPVAREGGEFHPLGQVKAFATHLEEYQKRQAQQAKKKRRAVLGVGFFVLLSLLGGGAFLLKREADARAAAEREEAKKLTAKLEKERKERSKLLNEKVELVALVSLGDIKDMKVGGTTPSKRPSRPTRPNRPKSPDKPEEPPPMVSQCQRSQGEIFGVLRKNLAKINICVEDEKKRDARGLLPKTLTLSFVAQPSGKVTDFAVGNRHYRTGPMRNCMLKAFKTIRFKPTGGSTCPVSIPIKIGG